MVSSVRNTKGRSWLRRMTAAVAVAALAVLAAPGISAAEAPARAPGTVVATGTAPVADGAHDGLRVTRTAVAPASTWDQCALYAWGYTGYTPCDTYYSWVRYSNGDTEYFVIGMDWSIWHVWRGSGGWKSLGGHAYTSTANGVWVTDTSPYVIIKTIGTDVNWWCRNRGNGSWPGGWVRC